MIKGFLHLLGTIKTRTKLLKSPQAWHNRFSTTITQLRRNKARNAAGEFTERFFIAKSSFARRTVLIMESKPLLPGRVPLTSQVMLH